VLIFQTPTLAGSYQAWPGQQRLTDLSARRLVQRGAEAANENGDGWRFRHDVRRGMGGIST